MFLEIYERRNLSLSRDEILHRLIEETAELVKPVLVFRRREIKRCLPDIIAWVFAFANRCKIDVDKVLSRYIYKPPGKPDEFAKIVPSLMKNIIGKEAPETIEDWQRLLGFLYRDENENITPELMISRLIEDLGNASRHLRIKEDHTKVEEEIAGVLGWTIALANKFDIKIDDALFGKYPNACHKCRQKPCRCFLLSTVFISYTKDTEDEMKHVKKLIEEELHLGTEVFEKLGPHYQDMRMVEALAAIHRSDGGIVILKDHYSENVRVELLFMLNQMEKNNVWICVQGKRTKKDKKLQRMLDEIKVSHFVKYSSRENQLLDYLKNEIRKRLEKLKEIKTGVRNIT
jgi:NTP pyrophosphatase (non-canonical NTP hydrolase)